MTTFRSVILVLLAALLTLAAASPAQSVPVAKLSGRIAPHGKQVRPGAPLTFALDTRFASNPPGGNFVLRRVDYRLPRGIVVNGRRFPACRVRTLRRAHGRLRACPKGSRIGRGVMSGVAVDIDTTSRARLALFNGPGGRSITINVAITTPAAVNTTISAPVSALKGSTRTLTIATPEALKRILDGDIVTSRIHLAIGATRTVHGVKRGYLEAGGCPSSGKAGFHGAFSFERGAKARADVKVAC